MEAFFHELADCLDASLHGRERHTAWLAAESSDYIRFNRGLIRQPGHVLQIYLTLTLIDGARHARTTFTLAGDLGADREMIRHALGRLRAQLPDLPEDPHLLLPTQAHSSTRRDPSRLPDAGRMVEDILALSRGTDMVGFLATGPVWRGFANSLGQRNWHESASFNFDWSLVHAGDKAVKTTYAGSDWDGTALRARFSEAVLRLAWLRRPPVSLAPGAYRAYLTPTALGEMAGMLNWGGVSEKALRTRQSPLRRMRDEGLNLHPAVTMHENIADGLAPGFQENGFARPPRIPLIEAGRLAGSLVSPRTAKEYGIPANGADSAETMTSLDLAPGQVPASAILSELDTGVYVSNLWYLNFSDRAHCRLTGMTRFATFWVENGEIRSPLNVMRFDDSLFRLLGEGLLGLTRERELLLDTDTYGGRSTASMRLPGALIRDFRFVL